MFFWLLLWPSGAGQIKSVTEERTREDKRQEMWLVANWNVNALATGTRFNISKAICKPD